jgi:hypothetical protein
MGVISAIGRPCRTTRRISPFSTRVNKTEAFRLNSVKGIVVICFSFVPLCTLLYAKMNTSSTFAYQVNASPNLVGGAQRLKFFNLVIFSADPVESRCRIRNIRMIEEPSASGRDKRKIVSGSCDPLESQFDSALIPVHPKHRRQRRKVLAVVVYQ